MSLVSTRLPGKVDGAKGHLPTGSHSVGLSWFGRSRAKEAGAPVADQGELCSQMAPRGHTLLLKKTLQERLRLCKELVDTLEKLWRAELASRAAHRVGLWSGVLNTGYSGAQVVNSRVKERLPASGLLEEQGQKQGR